MVLKRGDYEAWHDEEIMRKRKEGVKHEETPRSSDGRDRTDRPGTPGGGERHDPAQLNTPGREG